MTHFQPWEFWLLLAVAAGLIELLFSTFQFLFVSFACLLAGLVSFEVGATGQLISFSIALFISLLTIRPKLIFQRETRKHLRSRAEAIYGELGKVIEAVDTSTRSGRILVKGEDWGVISEENFSVGETVLVEGHDGILLKIKRIKNNGIHTQ